VRYPEKGRCPWCKPVYCSLRGRPEDRDRGRRAEIWEDWLVERREPVEGGGWRVLVSRPGVSREVQVPPGGTWLSLAHAVQQGKAIRFTEAGSTIPWLPSPIPEAPRPAVAIPTTADAARLLQQGETEDGVDGEALVTLLEGMGPVPEAVQEQVEVIRAGEASVELVLEVLVSIHNQQR